MKVLNYRLTNLKSGTGYAVRVKAHNQYDVSNPSDTVELTTLKGRPSLLLLRSLKHLPKLIKAVSYKGKKVSVLSQY